jgi:hypothetical protein
LPRDEKTEFLHLYICKSVNLVNRKSVNYFSRGTTLIAAVKTSRRSTESDNSRPYDGGRPDAPTNSPPLGNFSKFFENFQSIGSGVYLRIRQRLLAPPAVSLNRPPLIHKSRRTY